jgi:hypothetical protein
MAFISRRLFEIQLCAHLDRMDAAFVPRVQRKVGFAWRPIIDQLYRERVGQMSFANRSEVLAECAAALVRLDQTIENR